ncbi:hypothetical protein ACFL1U_00335 [Patescibacteria group bacterium]
MSEIQNPNFEKDVQDLEKESKKNIYGNEKLLPEEARERVDSLIKGFKEYYIDKGYVEEPSVKISSGYDPTVRFIGSHISVFKPYLNERKVPDPGLCMHQDCLRTHNVDRLLDDEYQSQWGSYFPSIGTLASPERLNEAVGEVFELLEEQIKISSENILVRISSADSDLLEACRQNCSEDSLEIDSRAPYYYRHEIGIKEIQGRSFNIALKDPEGDDYSDIGNIILLESNKETLGIETALGVTTILKQLHGLDHVQDCNPVSELNGVENEIIRRKFEDAIITGTVLYGEGLRPFGQHNRNRILKKYMRALSYFRARSGLDVENIRQGIKGFEDREHLGKTGGVAEAMVEYIKAYERDLLINKVLTKDENKIREALQQLT